MFENMLLKVWFWGNKSIWNFLFQDPKITVRVATDYFEVHIIMIDFLYRKSSLFDSKEHFNTIYINDQYDHS